MMWTCCAVLLAVFSLGLGAPVNSCDNLVEPIAIRHEDMLGKWLYIGGSSDLPGSRSLGRLMSSVWLNITETSQSNVLNVVQTQRITGTCSSLTYDVMFENSTMLIEKPFYLKEVYLPTVCSDCLVVYEKIISGQDTFTSHLFFSRGKSVPPAAVDMLKKQAECLSMPPPLMIDPNYEICPENISPSEGLSALNSLLENKMGHRVARLLDNLFDLFYN